MTYNVCVLLLVCPHFLKLVSHLPTCTCTVYILLAVHFCSENIYICYLNKKKKHFSFELCKFFYFKECPL